MKPSIIQTNTLRSIALTAGLSLAMASKATVPATDLPDFDNLPNFGQFGNNILEHNGTVNGNVGVSAGGTITRMAPTTINGDLFLGPSAGNSGSGRVTGSIFTGQDLSLEQATVFSVSSALAGLTPDFVFSTSQNGPFTYNVPAGEVQVVNFNGGLNLSSGRTITLTGDGFLVLNITGSLTLSGSTSGIFGDPANIFINRLGTGSVSTSSPTINGQYFTPFAAITLNGGVLNGGVFGGNPQINLHSGGTINAVPIPEPGITVMAALGGLSMIVLRRRFAA